MSEPINGVPRDRYGVWCPHGKHIMVADPDDDSPVPVMVPAEPWPCEQCTYEAFRSSLDAEFLTVEQLDALPEGARVIDKFGDVSVKRSDGLWDGYETAPLWSAKVAKWMPRLLREVRNG